MLTSFFASIDVCAWVAVVLTLMAAATDVRAGLIPNLLTLPILCAAPLVQLILAGPGACGSACLGAAVCALVPGFLFTRAAIGGGDVKLFAALGALVGWQRGLQIELCALWIATSYALFMLCWRGELWKTLRRSLALLLPRRNADSAATPDAPLHEMRLGAAVSGAALIVLVIAERVPCFAR